MICETIRTFGCAYVERINHAPRKSSTEHNATELYSIILKKNVNKNIQDVQQNILLFLDNVKIALLFHTHFVNTRYMLCKSPQVSKYSFSIHIYTGPQRKNSTADHTFLFSNCICTFVLKIFLKPISNFFKKCISIVIFPRMNNTLKTVPSNNGMCKSQETSTFFQKWISFPKTKQNIVQWLCTILNEQTAQDWFGAGKSWAVGAMWQRVHGQETDCYMFPRHEEQTGAAGRQNNIIKTELQVQINRVISQLKLRSTELSIYTSPDNPRGKELCW